MSHLFTPYHLKSLTLKNRIALPPMCQYMAKEGIPNEWHYVHYSQIARSGIGLVIVEATGVAPEGRITPNCLGLWNDEQQEAHTKLARAIKDAGSIPGIQIAHAGRKAAANIPWEGDNHMDESDPRAWQTIAPSAIAFGGGVLPKVPKEMSIEEIQRVKNDFVNVAKRALEAGYEWLELHFAHGYLAQSFFSPYANQRTDEYGGDAEGRGRFLVETMQAVREVWPEHLPLTMRFGVLEFDGKDEQTLQESIDLVKKFKDRGLDFLSVSMGFNTPDAKIPWGPSFMAPIAKRVREEVGIDVASAWGFGKPELANNAIVNEELDIVMVGRAFLANPHWTYEAAKALKMEKPDWVLPAPYAHWLERYKV